MSGVAAAKQQVKVMVRMLMNFIVVLYPPAHTLWPRMILACFGDYFSYVLHKAGTRPVEVDHHYTKTNWFVIAEVVSNIGAEVLFYQ